MAGADGIVNFPEVLFYKSRVKVLLNAIKDAQPEPNGDAKIIPFPDNKPSL